MMMVSEAGWDLRTRKAGARQQCGTREASATQGAEAGETQKQPWGKEATREMAEQGTGTCQIPSLALCSSDLAATNPAPCGAT